MKIDARAPVSIGDSLKLITDEMIMVAKHGHDIEREAFLLTVIDIASTALALIKVPKQEARRAVLSGYNKAKGRAGG